MSKVKQREQSNYSKYLKYQSVGLTLGTGDKTEVWYPTGKAEGEAYVRVNVTKEDDSNFTVSLEDGSSKTLPKNEKNYLGVNRPKFDGAEDMGELPHLNEPAVLHNLKKRYFTDLFHTYSGLFCVVVNPYKRLPIYTNEIIDIYRGQARDKLAPHIFAMADTAYRAMLNDKKNQSMLITGESGAGKTENTKKVIQYLTAIAGRSAGESVLEEQLLEFNPVLEAFGNAKTTRNKNSSRFGKFIELQFNAGGQIAGANTLIYLLEKSRVVAPAKNERNFHIFYQILSNGIDKATKEKLHLTRPEDYFFLSQSDCTTVDSIDDAEEFKHSVKAFNVLNVNADERFSAFEILSAILHLGNLPFSETGKGEADLSDTKALDIAAGHLGVDPKKLKSGLVSPSITVAGSERVAKALNKLQAAATRDALCKALYGRLFLWIVKRINEVLSHPEERDHFLGVLDISGFEIFTVNSFEQLCINYTNEKLQQFFNHHMFTLEQEEYEREKIDWTFENFGLDLQDTINLIEKEPNGILVMLDDENALKGANDKSFTKKLFQTHGAHRSFRKPKFEEDTNFKIVHYAGEVTYQTADWLEKNRDPLEADLQQLMKDSDKGFVRGLFDPSISPLPPTDDAAAKSNATRKKGDRGTSFMTVSVQYKEQLDQLMTMLRGTNPHFIRCIIPNAKQTPGVVQDALVLEQLRCNGVLEGIRIARKGWPNRIKFADFVKRYILLRPNADAKAPDVKQTCKDLVDFLASKHSDKVKPENFKMGITKIFFRAGQLALIEQLREQVISRMVVSIQAVTRAYISRRNYNKIHEQEFATRKIQRFVRAWLELRNWDWWKIYLKGRGISSQRNYQAEIDELEAKIKIVEAELIKAKSLRDKLLKDKTNIDADIKDVTEDISEFTTNLEDLDLERNKYSREVDSLKKEASEVDGDYEEETKRVNALMKAKQELQAAKTSLETSLEDEAFRAKQLTEGQKKAEDERDEFKSQFAIEEAKSQQAQLKVEDIERELATANDRVFELETDASTLRSKVKATEKTLAEAEQELDRETGDKAALNTAKGDLTERLEATKTDLQSAEEDALAAENQSKKIQGQFEAAQSELEDIRGKLSKAERAEKDLKSSLVDAEDRLGDERSAKENLEKAKKIADTKVAELEGQLRNIENAKNSASEQAKNLKTQLEEATRRLEESEAAANRLKLERKTVADDVAELEDHIEQEKDSGRKEKKRLTTKIQELTDRLNSAPTGDANLEDLKLLEDKLTAALEALSAADAAKYKAERLNSQSSINAEDYKQQLEDANRSSVKQANLSKRLEADLAEVRESLAAEKDSKTRLEENSAKLTSEAEELRKRVTEAALAAATGTDSVDYRRENNRLKKEHENYDRENRAFEREIKLLEERLLEAQHILEQEKVGREKLTETALELKKSFTESERSNSDLITKIQAANEEDKLALEQDLAGLREKNASLKTQLLDAPNDSFESLPSSKPDSTPAQKPASSPSETTDSPPAQEPVEEEST